MGEGSRDQGIKGSRERSRLRRDLARVAAVVLLALGGAALAFPLVWMVAISVKTREGAQAAMVSARGLLPRVGQGEPRLSNYVEALEAFGGEKPVEGAEAGTLAGEDRAFSVREFLRALVTSEQIANSVVVTTLVVAGTVLSCSLVGFAFARMRFRGRGPMFVLMLSTMMLPAQVTMIPLFLLFRELGWVDTVLPLVVPAFFGAAFFVFMFRQFFAGISEELLEAARIDGASNLGIWWRVMLPLCTPVVAITAIFTFIWTWNDFMNPLIYLHSPEKATLAVALNTFKSQHGGIDKVHLMMAGAVVTMVPCVVLFVVAQRYFVEGLNVGGVKG